MTFYQKLAEIAHKNIERNKDTITVVGVCVFAQQEDGLYSMYLPAQVNADSYELSKLHCVVTNIEKFHLCRSIHSEEMFLLKVKTGKNTGFWMPIFPRTFSWYLSSELVKARFEDTPKIYFEGETEAIVLKEFYYLGFNSYMVFIDEINYLICQGNMDVLGGKINVKLQEFKSIKAMPINNQFIVKDEKGECFYDAYDGGIVTFGPATSIEEIRKKDYPLLSKNYHGYFLKDESNNILKIYIAEECSYDNYTYSYKITLNNPTKQVKFLKRIIIKEGESEFLPELAAEIWGITYVNGNKDVIIQIIGDKRMQYTIKYSDLIF